MRQLLRGRFARELAVGLVLGAVVAALVLSVVVYRHPMLGADVAVSQDLQEDGGMAFVPVMALVSAFGTPAIAFALIILSAAAFFILGHRREAIYVLCTPLASGANALFKYVVNRPRPTASIVTVYERLSDSSFPSGHVVFYVVFFGFLATTMVVQHRLPLIVRWLVGGISFVLIATVSISRVYLGLHWLTDVIGGYLIGFILLSGYLYFYFQGFRHEMAPSAPSIDERGR